METYLFASWSCHQLSNRVEDNFELFIVLAFQLVQSARKFGVGREHLSQLYKGEHDLDVDGYRRLLRNTLESIAMLCSVKAYGRMRIPMPL
jgi:hypothetical protein